MRDVVGAVLAYNEGRVAHRLQLKYRAMRKDAFSFFRGTCHLFYEDLPVADPVFQQAPAVWVCGDLHFCNFGTYRGDNRLLYFDISDLDNSLLAPCTWDLARFLTSLFVAGRTLGLRQDDAALLGEAFLNSYSAALTAGPARMVEQATADGIVKDLFKGLKRRKRRHLLADRTRIKRKRRRIDIGSRGAEPVTQEERAEIVGLIDAWRVSQSQPDFYRVRDVANRIAGIDSLGVERYLVLVEGKGSPNRNYLLDLKEIAPSILRSYMTQPQPDWPHEAGRVAALYARILGTPPAHLAALEHEGKSYLLRELQPHADKVKLEEWGGKLGRMERLMGTLGQVVAWDHRRSSGRDGSAIADELLTFAGEDGWRGPLLDYARAYSQQVEADYEAFCTAIDTGRLTV
ncbi:MAG: DUF2252 family protein [Anaerolineae bacterium]|nr:DUF2252 family protein [Anaerolineae bacterium]